VSVSNGTNTKVAAIKKAFIESVYRQYNSRLVRYLARQNIGAEDVTDIAQETYYRMCRVEDVETIDHPQAFLFRTATNLMLDHVRNKGRRGGDNFVSFDGDIHTNGHMNGNLSHEQLLEARESLRTFNQALNELPSRCRQVFVLHRFEGMTYAGIAKHYGITVSAVNKHMIKALAHFHTRMGKL